MSPRTSSTNTIRSGISLATTTASNPFQPTYNQVPSGVSMHIAHVRRNDDQRTVLERQQDMRRRLDRLAQADFNQSEGRSAEEWRQDESYPMNNQSSNDDHELLLEMQLHELALAKKQINDALKRSAREANSALEAKEEYDRLAYQFEMRGYANCSTLNTPETDSSLGQRHDGSSSTGTSTIAGDSSERENGNNQEDHELDSVSPTESIVVASEFEDVDGSDRDSGEVSDSIGDNLLVQLIDGDLSEPLDQAATHRDLGAVLLTKKDFPGAAAELQRSLELDPACAITWYHLAKALDGNGESTAAEVAIHKALALKPDSLSSLSLLGKLLNARGEHDEAIVIYRRALNLQSPKEDLASPFEG